MAIGEWKECGSEALAVFPGLEVNIEEGSFWAECCYCGQRSTTLQDIEVNTNLIESGVVAIASDLADKQEDNAPKECVYRCYQCMALLIDKNPGENDQKVSLEAGEKYLNMAAKPIVDNKGHFVRWRWVCPNCLSDEFLVINHTEED